MTRRVGIVGCGAIARRAHLPALRDAGADVAAFASRTRASAEAARSEWGSGTVHDTWRELVARGDLDAVVVCTPNASHADISIAALTAGAHVLVEKPMAVSVADCDRMITTATANERLLAVAHNVRGLPPFVAMARAVRGGRIGEVVAVRAAFGHSGPERWAPDAAWFFERSLSGGGALVDLGVHVADLVRAVTGLEVRAVDAMLAGRRGDVEESASVLLQLHNGATGVLQASWAAVPGPDHQLTVFGRDATVHLDGRTAPTLTAPGRDPERLPIPDGGPPVAARFVRALDDDTGTRALPTALDGRAAVAIVEAAYRAAATRSVAPVAPFNPTG
jgi:predicted dehydrogenase